MFSRIARTGTLSVDGIVSAEGEALGSSSSLNVQPPFYVGGVPQSALNNTAGKIPVSTKLLPNDIEEVYVTCIISLWPTNAILIMFTVQLCTRYNSIRILAQFLYTP